MNDGTTPDSASQTPRALVDGLVDLLQLEPLEVDLFRGGRTSEPWVRVFGGQVVGQALMAACRTVDSPRLPHSLHAYFMRPGDPNLPIVYQVSRDRDGGSFSSRRVVAIQHGKPILNLAASFHGEEEGVSHQIEMPDLPGPEGLENERTLIGRRIAEVSEQRRNLWLRERPIEFRPVDQDSWLAHRPTPPHQAYWLRAVAPLPDDQVLHRVLLTYASDMMLLSTSLLPHGLSWVRGDVQEASLDHALWIHRPFRIDDWLLYTQDSPWAGGARGMNRGFIYARDGTLVASVAQEGLIRTAPDTQAKPA